MDVFKQCEFLLKAGKVSQAQSLLKQLNFKKLTRKQILLAANIARRTSEVRLGLKLLRPLVLPKVVQPLRESEVAEYATLLNLNGNTFEALQFLTTPKLPESYLAKAWCYFDIWNYTDSIPVLRKYLSLQSDPYYKAAGRVNLAEALCETQSWSECVKLSEIAIRFSEKHGFDRLHANALHIRSRCFAAMGRLKDSNRDLESALKLFGSSRTGDAFLIHRQKAFNSAAQTKNLSILRDLIVKAREFKSWSSLREIEFQALQIQFDETVFQKLYFGTPYEPYRNRLRKVFGEPKEQEYGWGESDSDWLDLKTGTLSSGKVLTKQNLKTLRRLLSDLYEPQSIGSLFYGIFPDEHFNPDHSPNRVHQAILRLKEVLKKENVPLQILCRHERYEIAFTGPYRIRLHESYDQEVPLIEKLSRKFTGEFSAGSARKYLNLSKSNVNRVIRDALQSGAIERIGLGRATKYKIILNR